MNNRDTNMCERERDLHTLDLGSGLDWKCPNYE